MKRSSSANRLMTEVELALLSGCNLADLEAEIQASSDADETTPRVSDAQATGTAGSSKRPRSPSKP